MIEWIETATRFVLSGAASGLVTAPIAKSYLYAAGFKFPGHTEFLGELAPPVDAGDGVGPIMMLTARDLRVSLVTIHEASGARPQPPDHREDRQRRPRHRRRPAPGFRRGARPRGGMRPQSPRRRRRRARPRGDRHRSPGRRRASRERGVDATGPHPSDSLFHDEARGRYDAALCLYHDQALIPVKMLDFWGGVNVTLGLPIVRTSPDHGTGFDIAGKGLAKPDSLIAAIRLAAQIAANRAR